MMTSLYEAWNDNLSINSDNKWHAYNEAKDWRLNDQSTILTIFMEQELIKDK